MSGIDNRYGRIGSRSQILDLRPQNKSMAFVIPATCASKPWRSGKAGIPYEYFKQGELANILKSKIHNLYSAQGAKS